MTCCLCHTNLKDPLNLGEMKTYQCFSAHYYCLLLATTITQSGDDNEGILGFMPKDIMDELGRAKRRLCTYCHKIGASVLCETKTCRVKFHLPCGIQNRSGHQFFGRFISHCVSHRPRQKFVKSEEPLECPICYDPVDLSCWTEIINSPCCKKFFFHKSCVQKMALNAGYFCKCPVCNNTTLFHKTMKLFGVFIPDRDASWELVPNAFEELHYSHKECNAEQCLCSRGRKHEGKGRWTLVICPTCGSQGTHMGCSLLSKGSKWTCTACHIASTTTQPTATTTTPTTSRETQSSAASSTHSSFTAQMAVSTSQFTVTLQTPESCSKSSCPSSANQARPTSYVVGPTITLDSDEDEIVVVDDDDVPPAPKRFKPDITDEDQDRLFIITDVRSLSCEETERSSRLSTRIRSQEKVTKIGTWTHTMGSRYHNDSRSDREFDTQQNAPNEYKDIVIID